MWEAFGYIGLVVVIGGLVTVLARAVRTSGLKKVGWFAEFNHDEKPPKQLNQ
jgi:hypothetical protein